MSTRTRVNMQKGIVTKYRPFAPIDLPDRQWPSKMITTAPTWCSVDLRDGNQALPIPMSVEEKLEMFDLLVKIGFKEIEVGFPSASQTEYDFMRRLIEENRIPDDVTIQVLVQAKEDLIYRTFESLRGAKKAILHIYNSTSAQQRRIVFGLDKPDIVAIAVRGVRLVKELAATLPETDIVLEYSPESFSLTEIDFALEICEAVVDVWQPTPEKKIILNLPTTVEVSTPNIHADQIEWFCRHLRNRETAIISLHTHNDRGTGVASSELGLLAGAERVEGTLFGNGERTGNVDIVTLALNMYTQGVDPGLDFSDIQAIQQVYEKCTRLPVPIRQPYAGELVFTAFSGSHQDAINKGMNAQETSSSDLWDVPYLPIDPKDIGRSYEAIIRINSQSGKGGVAYLMESEFGLQLPKAMHIEFGKVIKRLADMRGSEILSTELFAAFENEYLIRTIPFALQAFESRAVVHNDGSKAIECVACVEVNGVAKEIRAQGNGPIDAFVRALNDQNLASFKLLTYTEHAIGQGAETQAVTYIQLQTASGTFFGAAMDSNIEIASIKAVLSGLNRSLHEA
ncbi:2-isopropylmalate synthase [Dictyobacter formicarum]|uniref:2-isopropylmalate synthase n=2 Tax=Dictyobacter formicarum TaxID=2778368 RepID=A0ABQ3VAW7_9CHLR|nr:2-isopropylmalate synthase [Dictyobacter formicarum]GHO82793.1 2-isopropylmalate synthase [Dictyobacter formicarum]